MTNPEKKDAAAEEKPAAPASPSNGEAAKPTLQVNPTIQLDIGQVDLLDVPLPPSSGPSVEEKSTSKGPPPLPLVSPEPTPAPAPATTAPATTAPGHHVNARQLLDSAPSAAPNPILRFALGLGVATIICVGLWFGLRAMRKPATPPPPAVASASAPSASAAPMRTITIAPIEMTGPAGSASEDKATAAPPPAAPSAKPTGAATATSRATTPAGTAKPRGTDDVIKVEN